MNTKAHNRHVKQRRVARELVRKGLAKTPAEAWKLARAARRGKPVTVKVVF